MVLTMVIDWILICNVFFFVLILASSKVVSSHNQAHTLLKKLGTNSLTLAIGILYKSASLVDTQTAFLFWFLFSLELNDEHYVIHVILLDIQDQLQDCILLNYCW